MNTATVNSPLHKLLRQGRASVNGLIAACAIWTNRQTTHGGATRGARYHAAARPREQRKGRQNSQQDNDGTHAGPAKIFLVCWGKQKHSNRHRPPPKAGKTALFSRKNILPKISNHMMHTLGVMIARDIISSPSAANAQRILFLPKVFMAPESLSLPVYKSVW